MFTHPFRPLSLLVHLLGMPSAWFLPVLQDPTEPSLFYPVSPPQTEMALEARP